MDDESSVSPQELDEEGPDPADVAGRVLHVSRLHEPLRTLPLRPPVRVSLGAAMADAVRKMREARAGACLVDAEDGRLAGIVTERDLLVRVPLDGVRLDTACVEQFMHPNPETLMPDHPIVYALNRMAGGGYRNVPLVDRAGRAVGLVTLRDIVEEIIEHFGDDVLNLPPTRRAEIAKEREGA
jgi:CBS domain-containing protein